MSNFKPKQITKQITESNTKIREAKDLEVGDWFIFGWETESRYKVDKIQIIKGIVKITLEHCSGAISNYHYKTSARVTIIPRRTHSWGVGGTNLYFHF